MRPRSILALAPILSSFVFAFVACNGDDDFGVAPKSSDGGTDATVADAAPDTSNGDSAPTSDAGPSTLKHIFYVMMENHGYLEIVNNVDAPYINSLITQYGTATNYFGVTHPSLPNYLSAISGDFQGIWDDCAAGQTSKCDPEEFIPTSGDGTSTLGLTDAQAAQASATAHWFDGDTIVDQLDSKSITWKAYMQGIPAVGSTDEYAPVDTVDAGDGGTTQVARKLYAQKHDPFMYFSKVRNDATRMQKIVPFTQLATDLGAASSTPGFVWISPDQCHDMHGVSPDNANAVGIPTCGYPSSGLDHGAITLGDDFLKSTVQAIMASPAWSEPSAIVIVWDEDDYTGNSGCCGSPVGADASVLGGAHVPAIVITSKNAKHQELADPVNHYSLLATIEEAWGLPCLANACNVPAKMTKLFNP
jgi:hypothetical protein